MTFSIRASAAWLGPEAYLEDARVIADGGIVAASGAASEVGPSDEDDTPPEQPGLHRQLRERLPRPVERRKHLPEQHELPHRRGEELGPFDLRQLCPEHCERAVLQQRRERVLQ